MKRQTLLAAVLADPDSDAPRLAFADWLAANGQPAWAAVICKQLVRSPELGDAPAHIWRVCAGDLPGLADVEKEATRELPPGITFKGLLRGFPEKIHADVDTFLQHADTLFARIPLRTLSTNASRGANDFSDGVKRALRDRFGKRLSLS